MNNYLDPIRDDQNRHEPEREQRDPIRRIAHNTSCLSHHDNLIPPRSMAEYTAVLDTEQTQSNSRILRAYLQVDSDALEATFEPLIRTEPATILP